MRKKLNVLYQSNDAYASLTGISLTSLFINNPLLDISVYILDSNISKANKNKIKKLCDSYKSELHFIAVTKIMDKIKDLNVAPYNGNYATYLRIFAINLLDIKEDYILSIDGDTIINGDLSELLKLNLENYLCAGVCDSVQNSYKDYLNIPSNDNYYNCGVLLFNIKKWKQEKCELKIENHLKNVRNKYFLGDQDIINTLFRKQFYKLNIKYNFNCGFYIYGIKETFYLYNLNPSYYYSYDEVNNEIKEPLIYHLMGTMTGRPWEKDNIHPQKELFETYKQKSLWKNEEAKYIKRSLLFKIQKRLYLLLPRKCYLKIHKLIHSYFMKKMNSKVYSEDDNKNIFFIAMFGYNKKSKIKKNGYYDFMVGANNYEADKNDFCDNVDNNISNLNPSYCELTGMYWLWKNSNCRIIGTEHYRRFFYSKHLIFNFNNVLSYNKIKRILQKNDIIVPVKCYTLPKTVYEHYKANHIEKDLLECRKIILKKFPDYINAFDTVMNRKYYYPCNMMITKKQIYDDYCSWLFNVLFEAEKNFDYSYRDQFNKRACGFLGERLFNVWLLKNKQYKLKEMPVYNNEQNLFKQEIISVIKRLINCLKLYKKNITRRKYEKI